MYTVTAWVLLALLLGWDTSCGCDKCQNLETTGEGDAVADDWSRSVAGLFKRSRHCRYYDYTV